MPFSGADARPRSPSTWWSAGADLVLGADCAACGAPGLDWCVRCAESCRPRPRLAPASLEVPVLAAQENAGPLARAIVAWKDRGRLRLTRPLGHLLAAACLPLADGDPADDDPLILVPVPTAPAAVRRRGADPVRMLAERATIELGRVGVRATVRPALRRVRRTRDQASLGVADRRANVTGAFAAQRARAAELGRTGGHVLVVDDVLTTGASAGEAVRALGEVGVAVAAVAVVAFTPAPTVRSS